MKNRSSIIYVFFLFIMNYACINNSVDITDYESYPVYSGDDLELTYSPEKSKFRIWAPTATDAKVLIYENCSSGKPAIVQKMKKDIGGTWLTEINGDLKNKYYTFRVKINRVWLDETPGIYAKAVGINGKRGMIIDFAETNPEGWDKDISPPLENYNDIIIYELHVRDISMNPNSGIKNRGKFLGLTEEGTRSPEGEKTGIYHFEELGITHVHMLPSFDFRSINETALDKNIFNWGYDPLNFNSPEGSYSTDPCDGNIRIIEFKKMVQALHKKGIRVIMDVVYNHTGESEKSTFNLLVPGYYYRHNADGAFSNASACGNETASEREMMRKYMVESLKHWAEEYHIDGFRFDLMGIHDIETMNQISRELHKIDPTIFLYGEGWTAGSSPLPEKEQALKKHTYKLDSIAAFSDDIRDGIKGKWNKETDRGFVSGKPGLEESIKFGVAASTEHPQIDYSKVNYSDSSWATEPYQTITYVSCHDNHTLWDKLKIANPDASETDLIKMHKLANTIVMTSQGIPFLHAGVDFLRTKQGVENSFESPDSINSIDWSRKNKYKDVFNYYKDLIKLRKNHPGFRMSSGKQIREHLEFIDTGKENVVAFLLKDYPNGDEWKNILVIYNGNNEDVIVEFPFKKWTVVFNENGLNENGYRTFKNSRLTVPPISAVVLAEIVPR